jgi:glycosyltransferase involved in cell wall biosynthesis
VRSVTSSSIQARVLIGLPVYNGSNYLRNALNSLLAQTYQNWRALVADNASTDETPDICQEYAAMDDRITVLRHETNIGAAPNFNFVFQPQGETYFKWAAHDDVMHPDYLGACVALMDADPDVAMAHSYSNTIDHEGKVIGTYDNDLRLDAPTPQERFWRILWTDHFTEAFAMVRTDVCAKTALMGSYPASDRNWIAEICLHGGVKYADGHLFSRRTHKESYMASVHSAAEQIKWFNPKVKIPNWLVGYTKFQEYMKAIGKAPLSPWEKVACTCLLGQWAVIRSIDTALDNRDRYRQRLRQTLGDGGRR